MNAMGLLQSKRDSGGTYFLRDPLRSYFDEYLQNKIYFLNKGDHVTALFRHFIVRTRTMLKIKHTI